MRPLIALLILFGLSPFFRKQTGDFTLACLHSPFPKESEWDIPIEPSQLTTALNQPFYYLNTGGQAFAFVSEDGQYVLKCIKNHLRSPHYWALSLSWPTPLRRTCQNYLKKKLAKRSRDFTSYKLAASLLKEESALLCVHLNPTDCFHTSLQLVDKLNIQHEITLDKTEFILQKRATPLHRYLDQVMQEGRVDLAKNALHATLDLLKRAHAKGIYDEDPKLHTNIGILDNGAIFIDVGRLTRSTQPPNLTRLIRWVAEHHPLLLSCFKENHV